MSRTICTGVKPVMYVIFLTVPTQGDQGIKIVNFADDTNLFFHLRCHQQLFQTQTYSDTI